MDFVEICNVCSRKVIIEAAKRIINSDKVCRSYSDLNFGVTFLEHSVVEYLQMQQLQFVMCGCALWTLIQFSGVSRSTIGKLI